MWQRDGGETDLLALFDQTTDALSGFARELSVRPADPSARQLAGDEALLSRLVRCGEPGAYWTLDLVHRHTEYEGAEPPKTGREEAISHFETLAAGTEKSASPRR